ncbi:unannotated protein [freshwater metagenome]|uniref:Unannotated protein n=1 Tax=freshwater metagenome TaxID=449393 RepID=A0A6J7E8Q7_9ZZZZ
MCSISSAVRTGNTLTLPFVIKVLFAAVIAVSVSAAAAARPPSQIRPGLTGIVLGGSLVLYAVALAFLSQGKGNFGAVLLVVASEGMCAAAWLGRAIVGGNDDEGGGGEPRRPTGPRPSGGGDRAQLDWTAFENFRKSWSRERATKGSSDSDD